MVDHGWADLLPDPPNDAWMNEAVCITKTARALRKRATYKTGTIIELEAYLLRAIVERLQARVVVEVGTYIGTSTRAMASGSTVSKVYTCDFSNDCLPSDAVIHTFPKVSSTDMLRHLAKKGVRADFCFFDGVLSEDDVSLLLKVTHEQTVLSVHDYTYGAKRSKKEIDYKFVARKGVQNTQLIASAFPTHRLVPPMPGTTLAVMVLA